MKRNLIITCLVIQTVIVSLLFANVFVTKPAFFQYLITAKQWGVELVMLIAIIFLVLYILLMKEIKSRTRLHTTGRYSSVTVITRRFTDQTEKSGQQNKDIQTAGEILNGPVKVKSTAIREMKNEMKNIMTQSGTTCPDDSGKKSQSTTEK
jgi:hypothetical protein